MYLSEQHKYIDLVYWFLFGSAACFGCLFQPTSGSQKSKRGEMSPYRCWVWDYCKIYGYFSEKWI